MNRFLAVAIALVSAITLAQAAEIKRAGGNISITGMIAQGDAAKFKAALASNIGGTIILNSPGGYVGDAITIGHLSHTHSYATKVPRRAICASACVLIWLAGIHREFNQNRSLACTESGRSTRKG